MDGETGRRETGKRQKKYAQKIKEQRSISIEKEKKLMQYFICHPLTFIIQQTNTPYSIVVGLERLSSGKVSERISTRDAFLIWFNGRPELNTVSRLR